MKPTHVLNAAGVTGRPNVDWCESHKVGGCDDMTLCVWDPMSIGMHVGDGYIEHVDREILLFGGRVDRGECGLGHSVLGGPTSCCLCW